MPKGHETLSAYTIELKNERLKIDKTLTTREGIDSVNNAVGIVLGGGKATVKNTDMVEFRRLWEGRSIESEELGLPTKAELVVMIRNLEIG